MESKYTRPIVALGVAAALAVPAVATAHPGNKHGGRGHAGLHGKKPSKPRYRALVLKGTVAAVGDGTIDVVVARANHRGKALRGQTVTVDVSTARISARDVNGDGTRDLADVAVGDRVGVESRIAKGETPDPAQPIVARRVVDVGPKHDETGGEEEPPADTPPAP